MDFENVTLSAVLAADLNLYTGSFRESERAFAMLTQTIGRAGRRGKPAFPSSRPISPATLSSARR
jgi:primosomal protein N' (replication factor Y)